MLPRCDSCVLCVVFVFVLVLLAFVFVLVFVFEKWSVLLGNALTRWKEIHFCCLVRQSSCDDMHV